VGLVHRNGLERLAEHVVGERERRRDLVGRGRVGPQAALGDPHAADVDRTRADDVRAHPVPGADDHLGRAAADVGDHERAVVGIEVADRAGEAQPGLLVAGDHLRLDAQHVSGHAEELVAVRRVAGGGGGDHADPLGTLAPADRRVVGEGRAGALECRGTEPPGGVDSLAEADDAHLAMDVAQVRGPVTADRHVGHQQPD
jgi:hypothetical protein